MTTEVQPQVVRSFLTQLDAALVGVPEGVNQEIILGITEELSGLDAATAAARIEELGDPAFIAEEARREAGAGQPGLALPAPDPESRHDRQRYTIVTTALLLAGGIVVPLIGWVVGVAMLWSSRTWQLRDKLIGTLVLPGGALSSLLLWSVPFRTVVTVGNDAVTPALSFLDGLGIASGIVVVLLPFGVFVYLLWRAQRLRGESHS